MASASSPLAPIWVARPKIGGFLSAPRSAPLLTHVARSSRAVLRSGHVEVLRKHPDADIVVSSSTEANPLSLREKWGFAAWTELRNPLPPHPRHNPQGQGARMFFANVRLMAATYLTLARVGFKYWIWTSQKKQTATMMCFLFGFPLNPAQERGTPVYGGCCVAGAKPLGRWVAAKTFSGRFPTQRTVGCFRGFRAISLFGLPQKVTIVSMDTTSRLVNF